MARIINCECGYVVTGDSDGELVANLERHIAQDHPEMVGTYERAELFDLIEDV
jgi:predicted small metal-binding protein